MYTDTSIPQQNKKENGGAHLCGSKIDHENGEYSHGKRKSNFRK
jgi:hypothetical protein